PTHHVSSPVLTATFPPSRLAPPTSPLFPYTTLFRSPAERGARSPRHDERAESAVFAQGGDQAIEVMLVGARGAARRVGALPPEGGVRQEKRDRGGRGRGRRAGERGLGGGGPGLDRVPARAPPHVGHARMPGAPHRAAMEEDPARQARPRDEEG